ILKTTDSGATWSPAGSGLGTNYMDLWVFGEQEIYVACDSYRILHTVNGGSHWDNDLPIGQAGTFDAVWGSSASDVFVSGTVGKIVRSPDMAVNWWPLTSGTSNNLSAMWSPGPGGAIFIGGAGVILRSDDDGASWQKLPVPSGDDFRG